MKNSKCVMIATRTKKILNHYGSTLLCSHPLIFYNMSNACQTQDTERDSCIRPPLTEYGTGFTLPGSQASEPQHSNQALTNGKEKISDTLCGKITHNMKSKYP